MWCDLVVGSMTRQERDGDAVMLEDVDWRGWVAPGRLRVNSRHGNVTSEALQPSATDYCNEHSS